MVRERVQQGIAILTEIDPHWWWKIDLGELDMESGTKDILGQLFGGYGAGCERIATFLGKEYCHDFFGADYGFNIGNRDDPTVQELQKEWERIITERVK